MSQIYKGGSSGPVPPTVATSYVTDVNSPAIPAANVLNVIGGSTQTHDDEGIRTDGSSGSNTLTVQLTNRAFGSTSTVGAVTSNILTIAMATNSALTITGVVTGFSSTGTNMAGAEFTAMFVRGAGAVTFVDGTSELSQTSGLPDIDVTASASGGDALIGVLGQAGFTINWKATAQLLTAS